ncbi:MAG: glycosyltransferase family 9 protein [Nitrospiria bacterium]
MSSDTQPKPLFVDDFGPATSFLVVRLGAIGDVLRVCPAVLCLRKAYPDAKIAWAVEQWVAPLLKHCPIVDRIHILDRAELDRGGLRALKEMGRFSREIRACRYNVALDFHGRFKSALVAWLSGAPIRVGYAKGQSTEMNHLFTNRHVFLENKPLNRIHRFFRLLEALGIRTAFNIGNIGISLPDAEKQAAQQWYDDAGRPALAVYAGSSTKQSAYHRWPVEKWIALLDRTGKEGISSVLFWGPDEEAFTREIHDKVSTACLMAPKTNLSEMMSMLACFPAFIGGNTAAMHMSWMQGVPVVFFPGPADPRIDGPIGPVAGYPLKVDHLVRHGISKRFQADVTTQVNIDEAYTAVIQCMDLAGSGRGSSATDGALG